MINNTQTRNDLRDLNTLDDQHCPRAQQRHGTTSVHCTLGDVVDLSTGGARIIATSIPRATADVEFYAMNKSVTVRAHVAWTRPTGSAFRHEIGLVFTRITRAQRDVINSLACGRLHRALL